MICMLILFIIAFIIGIRSIWDLVPKSIQINILNHKKIEIAFLICLIDLGVGIYYFKLNSSFYNDYLLLGLLMIIGALYRLLKYNNKVQFLSCLGYFWCITPEFINTIIMVILLSFYLWKKTLYT